MNEKCQQDKTQNHQQSDEKALKAYSIFGNGGWIGAAYVLEACPLCKDSYSFHFEGLTGIWYCAGCNKSGSFKDLKDSLCHDIFWEDKFVDLVEPSAPEGLIQLGKYVAPPRGRSIATGFTEIDRNISGLSESALSILSGKRGQGKSTWACQLALNIIHNGGKVCFYSGELSATMFQAWVVKQAAGSKYLEHYIDDFGADRYHVEPFIEERIKSWLIDKFILYDNGIVKSSERNSILERFLLAKRYYDCKYYFVDNLMTAKYTRDTDRDYFRQQSNFAGELTDFAMQEKVHVMLVAHPKKGESGDLNDDVAGLSDITNRASNVFFMKRLDDADREKKKVDYDNVLEITKNRDYGALVEIGFDFKVDSKKYIPVVGRTIESYGWESEL